MRPASFLLAVPAWFAFLVLMNAPHLGADAALHWDATDSIVTTTPMPTAAQLAAARPHVFDPVAEARSDDPAVVTAYVQSPAAAGRLGPLETVRRYYSQVSYTVARAAFAAGGWATGSPTGGVVAFQLTAAALVAVGLGGLTVNACGAGTGRGWRAVPTVLAFVAIAGSPVFLSISRQVLTETVGFAFLVPGLLLAAGRRLWTAAAAGVLLFLAVRSRYNLGPAIAVLLPLVLLLAGRRPARATVLLGGATVAGCIAADAAIYGPWFGPWAYNEALVRSTRLYFHTDPPYDAFWTALFVNAPLVVLPVLGVVASCVGALAARPKHLPAGGVGNHEAAGSRLRRRGPWQGIAKTQATADPVAPHTGPPSPHRTVDSQGSDRRITACAAAVLLVLAVPLVATAAQQVGYQPRHLFAVTGPAAVVLLLTVNRTRWTAWTAVPFSAVCGVTIAANLYSTLGPQRTTMRVPWPQTVAQALRHRWTTLGPHTPWPRVLLDGYFDWSDNRRVHDQLLTVQYKQRTPGDPLLVVGDAAGGSGFYCRFATQFAKPVIWWPPTGVGDTATVDAALAAGRPVLAVLPVGGTLSPYHTEPVGLPLDQAVLVRVTDPSRVR